MDRIDKENLICDIEFNIEKAEHMAEKIISAYDLDVQAVDDLNEKVFAGNRYNIWMDMEILSDYIRMIMKSATALREAVLA